MRWDISADRNKRGLIVELARKAVALRPDDARQWELFAHALRHGAEACPGRRRPRRLVLFPSFVPHATLPTKSSEPRICVAFDVVACRP